MKLVTMTVKKYWDSLEVQCRTQKFLGVFQPQPTKLCVNSQVCAQSCATALAIWPLHRPSGSCRRAPPAPPCHTALASAETTTLEGEGACLGTGMIWILIQERLGRKEKSLEKDDSANAAMRRCRDLKGKGQSSLMKTSLLKLILDDSAPSMSNVAKSKLLLRGRQLLLVILMVSSYSDLLF